MKHHLSRAAIALTTSALTLGMATTGATAAEAATKPAASPASQAASASPAHIVDLAVTAKETKGDKAKKIARLRKALARAEAKLTKARPVERAADKVYEDAIATWQASLTVVRNASQFAAFAEAAARGASDYLSTAHRHVSAARWYVADNERQQSNATQFLNSLREGHAAIITRITVLEAEKAAAAEVNPDAVASLQAAITAAIADRDAKQAEIDTQSALVAALADKATTLTNGVATALANVDTAVAAEAKAAAAAADAAAALADATTENESLVAAAQLAADDLMRAQRALFQAKKDVSAAKKKLAKARNGH